MKKFAPRLIDPELPGLFRDDYGFWTHVKFKTDGRWHWRKLNALTKAAAVEVEMEPLKEKHQLALSRWVEADERRKAYALVVKEGATV